VSVLIYWSRRVAYKLYELTHPEEPWMSQRAVRFLDRVLGPDMMGFEWGSGRSTLWFGRRLSRLISIESDPTWYERTQRKLRQRRLSTVECHLIPLDHPMSEPTRAVYPIMPRYVAAVHAVGDLDLAVIDGHYRQACVLASLAKLKPGGYLLIDNTDWLPIEAWGVPVDWPIAHQSRNVLTQTTIWRRPPGV
jgi:hypothetical protein